SRDTEWLTDTLPPSSSLTRNVRETWTETMQVQNLSICYLLHAACQCDPQGSISSECDKVGGQCRCKANVIGRRCDQCAPGTYGFGVSGCTDCNCHPLGSEMAQCNRETGQCECRDGMAGARCDECARGFTGIFPNCVRCHQCFQLWDDYLCQMRRDLDHIQYNIQRILESGITPGVGNDRIKELEQKLKQVQDLIDAGDTDKIHQLIGQRMDDLRWATTV
ncbi:hypothetical protein XENOCAPTIV_030385, partial [Xenoophorus captivus]